MDERNRNELHDQSDDAADVPVRAGDYNGRPGSATNATSRAFVLELTSEATGTDAFCGRVQHLTTLDGGNFTSAESLVSIIRRVLERARRNQFDK